MSAERREQELIARAVRGHEDALERLLVSHHPRLSAAMATRLPADVRDVVGADDVLQEAYVVAFREITSFQPRGPGAFYRWLAKIAEHRLLDIIKSHRAAKRGGGRRRATPAADAVASTIVDWLEKLAAYERTPSRSAAVREAVGMVQSALVGLKPDYREALRLRYIEGLPVAEIATRMKRTEGAVCLLCHRGLKRMREDLGSTSKFFGPKE